MNEIKTNEDYALVSPENKLTDDQIESLRGFLDNMATLTMLRTNDAYWSEVDMVDPDAYEDLIDVGAFPELSGDVGFVGCFFDGSSTRGCAQHRTDQDDKRYSLSTDISLNANGSGIGIDPPVLDIGDSDITETTRNGPAYRSAF